MGIKQLAHSQRHIPEEGHCRCACGNHGNDNVWKEVLSRWSVRLLSCKTEEVTSYQENDQDLCRNVLSNGTYVVWCMPRWAAKSNAGMAVWMNGC